MVRPLPPFASLRAFEAVARNLSVTRAAEDLGLTQAAVSYQIKLLEERLGTKLFTRQPHGVALTKTAQEIAPNIHEAFNLLREVFDPAPQGRQETLSVSTTQGLATLWLVPRLGRFQVEHSEIAVDVETTDRPADFDRDRTDVVIRAGKGKWPGLQATKALDVFYAPMLSPELAASIGGVRDPADIITLPLLDPQNPWWASWLKAHDLPLDVLMRQSSPSLGTQIFSARAALEGQGVALLTPDYFQRELSEGQLVAPFPHTMEADWAYWLAYPKARHRVRKIRIFRDWLLKEAGCRVAMRGTKA